MRALPLAVLATVCMLPGCTVTWYQFGGGPLGGGRNVAPDWHCPARYELSVSASTTTDSGGTREWDQEQLAELREAYRSTTDAVLIELGCDLQNSEYEGSGSLLVVRAEERHYFGALAQEFLTGLSLGLIPSWGTLHDELKFEFTLDDADAAYSVDQKRINHVSMFPVFWLSSVLSDEQRQYRKALADFANGVQRSRHHE